MLSLIVVALSFAAPPQAACVSAYGNTRCGYGCVAEYGQIQCASTPQGVCAASGGKVVCWDPPGRVAPEAPAATCLEGYGTVACGWGCASGYGQVKCATTPSGTCAAAYGQVTCFDPPPPPRPHAPPAATGAAVADCLSAYGQTVCGYGCVADYGQVRCATTPQGVCRAAAGSVTCWDPPDPAAIPPGAPAATCLEDYGTVVCGWGCASGYGQVACAATPTGVCAAAYGKVVCGP